MAELQRDPILGAAYIDPEAFALRAHIFGAGMSIQNATRESLLALAAAASREIDAVCGRGFGPEVQKETHRWNSNTRRIFVNAPPVVELQVFRIRVGARSAVVEFQSEDVYYNPQAKYLELVAFSTGDYMLAPYLQMDLIEAQVEIEYKSFETVPEKVVMATGYTMGQLANDGFVNQILPPGFGELQIGGTKIRNQTSKGNVTVHSNLIVNRIPPIARDLLSEFIRLPIA
jgi:hypothetical protein